MCSVLKYLDSCIKGFVKHENVFSYGRSTHYFVSVFIKLKMEMYVCRDYYLNQCWFIVNLILGKKLQWNLYQYAIIFIQESASESVVGEIAVIHYDDVIMGTMASQITSLTIVYSTVYSEANQRKHQSSASLAFVRGIHRSVPGEFPAQMASNAENVPISWRHRFVQASMCL